MINIKKSLRSFKFAGKGIWQLLKHENNARVHLLASGVAISMGCFFRLSRNEWLWITLAIALVWITEAINTAIERLVDFISPEFDARAGVIKDLAAAAVLSAAIAALAIGFLVFWPYLKQTAP